MKKIITFVLAIALVLAMAVPAFAASPSAPESTGKKTALLPEFECDDGCRIIHILNAYQLPKAEREIFMEAQKTLKEVVKEYDMVAKYFFYHWAADEKILPCDHIFGIGDFEEVVVKQYVEKEWVDLEVTTNEDGTITVSGILNCPIVILTK